MIRFNILALLEQKKKTRYWLAKQMGMSHQNLSRIVNNETNSIHLETLETLCQVLECTPSDLFVIDPDLPEEKLEQWEKEYRRIDKTAGIC